MPMDSFFTSKGKNEALEKILRKTAEAKALQFAKFAHGIPKWKAERAMRSRLTTPDQRCAHALKGSMIQVSGGNTHKSLTGFKEPKKVWTEIRKGGQAERGA